MGVEGGAFGRVQYAEDVAGDIEVHGRLGAELVRCHGVTPRSSSASLSARSA